MTSPENENKPLPDQEISPDNNQVTPEQSEATPDASAEAWDYYINEAEKQINQQENAQQINQSIEDTTQQLAKVRDNLGLPQSEEVPSSIATDQVRVESMTVSQADRQSARERVQQSEQELIYDRNKLENTNKDSQREMAKFYLNVVKGGAAVGASILKLFSDGKLSNEKHWNGDKIKNNMQKGDYVGAAITAGKVYSTLDTVQEISADRENSAINTQFETDIKNAKNQAERARLQNEYNDFRMKVENEKQRKQTNKELFAVLASAAKTVFA